EGLRHAVERKNLAAGRGAPRLQHRRRQPLAGGDEAAYPLERREASGAERKQSAVEGRHAEERDRLLARDALEHSLGPGPFRIEQRGGAGRERAEQPVLERVGEEELRGRERALSRGEADHLALRLPGQEDAAM